jgi:GNAT superfamily N-acetyltransferase
MGQPPDTDRLLRELEETAFADWPAAEVRDLDGWRLRFTAPGVTRRGNSVWPSAAAGALSLDARIDATLAFYDERGAPARVQLTPVSEPHGLDATLGARDWEKEAAVSIQTAEAAAIAKPALAGVTAEVAETLNDDWFEVAGVRSRFGPAQDAYRGFLARIGPRAGFALARVEGQPAAAGLGVRSEHWVGVFSMFTLPEHRGRGLGRALVAALASWARHHDAPGLYLQVERDNPAALALYAGAGFTERYGYHYRRAPNPPPLV